MKIKVKDILTHITQKILPIYNSKNQALINAWWILEFVSKKKQIELITKDEISLTEQEKETLDNILLEHTLKKVPLQYIFGSIKFIDLTIKVRFPILIPRPETEYWCSELITKLKKIENQQFKILDLCTGTGCIGLSFAKSFKESHVYATDISNQACQLAQENAKLNEIQNVTIIQSDLFNDLPKNLKFDLILSNPPYISYKQWQKLDPMVKKWEAYQALVAKEHGLGLIKKIINEAHKWINYRPDFDVKSVAQLAIEIDYRQSKIVQNLLEENNNYKKIKIYKDLSNLDRIVTAGVINSCKF